MKNASQQKRASAAAALVMETGKSDNWWLQAIPLKTAAESEHIFEPFSTAVLQTPAAHRLKMAESHVPHKIDAALSKTTEELTPCVGILAEDLKPKS